MEHYKLIREYPGSLKLGTVVEAPEDCQTLFIIEDGVCFTYDQGLLDRYPEYWEKVLPEEGLLVHNLGDIVYRTGKYSGYGFTAENYTADENYTAFDVWTFSITPENWRKATKQEENKFTEMLWEKWVKMGNNENTKIEAHAKASLPKGLLNKGVYNWKPTCQSLWNKNGMIFYRGKFATPIKEEESTLAQVSKAVKEIGDFNIEQTESGAIILTPKNK